MAGPWSGVCSASRTAEVPPLRLGTRGSALARRQAQEAARALATCGVETEEVICSTQGDRDRGTSLRVLGGQGVFVRQLEEALREHRVDVAAHSAKDIPPQLLEGTELVAFLPRADVRDALVSRDGRPLADLPPGALIGTSSRRREAQLRAQRPDLRAADIRGNVDTRLQKVSDGAYDAIVLAAAGLARLDRLNVVTEYLSLEVMLPSPGQGAIALQARRDDADTVAVLRRINHQPTALAVRAERALLRRLGAGCTLAVAALAQVRARELTLQARILSDDGARVVSAQRAGAAADPEALGDAVAEALLAQGADALLRERVP